HLAERARKAGQADVPDGMQATSSARVARVAGAQALPAGSRPEAAVAFAPRHCDAGRPELPV
ncbi:hypothetical protein, partial [Xanthomonas arboricola]|uniref:hypothetical protein n=1 Tax=Xanthomonas arboricola TaxID=56448 RepID=UPI0019555530